MVSPYATLSTIFPRVWLVWLSSCALRASDRGKTVSTTGFTLPESPILLDDTGDVTEALEASLAGFAD